MQQNASGNRGTKSSMAIAHPVAGERSEQNNFVLDSNGKKTIVHFKPVQQQKPGQRALQLHLKKNMQINTPTNQQQLQSLRIGGF